MAVAYIYTVQSNKVNSTRAQRMPIGTNYKKSDCRRAETDAEIAPGVEVQGKWETAKKGTFRLGKLRGL